MLKQVFVLIIFLASFEALAQKGTVSGTIIEKETGEELIGANIVVEGTSTGTISDISGNYNLQLEEGTYTIVYSFVTFQKQIISDIQVKSNQITKIDIALEEEKSQLQEVVVSAKRIDNNEISLLKLQKKSISIQDGISAQEINKIGYSNSAESMKQVTGASVEGGKYIVMRGLGDRYSVSSMNGVVLPSTDPYRNSASLDLIPSTIIDNIVVKKTFSPDLSGNFTGGSVDITTKSLPDQFYLNANVSLSYNDQSTFNRNFKADKLSGATDWLGYDDGTRALPQILEDNPIIRNPVQTRQRIEFNPEAETERINDYNNTMRALSNRSFNVNQKTPGIDRRFVINTGNRYNLGDHKLGYNLGLNYSNGFNHYDEREITNYTARISSENRMQIFQQNRGTESQEEVNVGGIFTLAYQLPKNHEFGFNWMFNNNATSSVLDMSGGYPGALSSGETFENRAISYIQRELNNMQVTGNHLFGDLGLKWSANYITSNQDEPDTRFIGTDVLDGSYGFDNAEYALPFHFFRILDDTQVNGKLDFELPVFEESTIKFGGLFQNKQRDFTENRFQAEIQTQDFEAYTSPEEANGDFDLFFGEDNTGIIDYRTTGIPIYGNSYVDQSNANNTYEGTEQVMAGYVMGVFPLTEKLKTVAGARIEKTDFEVVSLAEERGAIDELNILPSLNFIYEVNDNSNLRTSFSRTLARPNMREIAPFIAFDLLGGFPVIGNPDIKQTDITNFDLRYEIFPKAGELIAISGFYKDFTNPIIKELDATSDQPQYQYVNTNKGFLVGAEIEFRKNLDFIGPAFRDFKISSNLSYIYSRVDLSEQEYNIRSQINPDIQDWRPFAAQSPYLANLVLSYNNAERGWETALAANVFGPRLAANGAGAAPDVYEVYNWIGDKENGRIEGTIPVPDINFRVRKAINERVSAAFTINNLLDYSIVNYQEHNGTYFTNSALNPGRTFKVSFNYSID